MQVAELQGPDEFWMRWLVGGTTSTLAGNCELLIVGMSLRNRHSLKVGKRLGRSVCDLF